MKVRFELNCRDTHEDIITFDFTQLVAWRGYEDTILNDLVNPRELYKVAKDIITQPITSWEKYSDTNEDGEPIYVYPHGTYNILFSVPYYRQWRNGDRKYQLFIEGIKVGEVCYARYL